MEIAGAEQAALEAVLDQSVSENALDMKLPEKDRTNYVQNYVETHATVPAETKTVAPSSDQVVSTTMSQSPIPQPSYFSELPPLTGSVTFTVDNTVIAQSTVSQPTKSSASLLNPSASSFKPMMTSRETTQTKWTYQSSLPTVTQNSETKSVLQSLSQTASAQMLQLLLNKV